MDLGRALVPRKLLLTCLMLVGLVVLCPVFPCPVANAAVAHEFLAPVTNALEVGPPSGCGEGRPEPPCISGSLSEVNALTISSGRLWVAERVARGGKQLGSRVDEFNDSTGAFLRQLDEEGGVSGLQFAVAVGHPAGEEQVYVGAEDKGNVVAVFGPSGKLQSEGIWSGKSTPTGSFGELKGVAVSGNVGLTQNDVYVAAGAQAKECKVSFEEGKPKCVVDVYPGEAGGKEPATVLAQLTGTCEKAEALPCAGSKLIPFAEPDGVAVSASSGDVFVADGSSVRCTNEGAECAVDVFEPSGIPGVYSFLFRRTGVPGEPFKNIGPVAVDGEGDFYVVDKLANVIDQFTGTGKFVAQLKGTGSGAPFTELESVAADPLSGGVFAGDFERTQHTGAVDVFGPSVVVPDVSVGEATEATPASVVLNGTVRLAGAGPAECRFEYGTSTAYGSSVACAHTVVKEKEAVSVAVSGLSPDTRYFFRLAATNESGGRKHTNVGECPVDCGSVRTTGPGVVASASEVSSTAATLDATIEPNGAATSYFFQYGTSSTAGCSPATCVSVPVPPGKAVGSEGEVRVEQHVQGLAPGTVYHYRVVAASLGQEFPGPDQTFTTQGVGGSGALPDGRRWELVSPPNKHGALLLPIQEGNLIQASASGGAVTYVASIPTEESVKGFLDLGVQVFSTRGVAGWSSRDISLAHAAAEGLAVSGGEYRFFSSDLSLGLVEPIGEFSSLAPEVFPQDTERTQYVRHNSTCQATPGTCFEPVVTGAAGYADVPAGTVFGGTKEEALLKKELELQFVTKARFVGASPDLAHVILRSNVALTAMPTEGKPELYEWSAARPASDRLQLVSLLPKNEKGEELPASRVSLGFGSSNRSSLGFENHVERGAVSGDGSQVAWSSGPHLYVRNVVKGTTVQLDVPEAGCLSREECGGGEENARFQMASTDGSRVFFTDTQQLTANAGRTSGKADVYECQISEAAGAPQCKLTDLTPSPGARKAADVQGAVVGASEDGSWVYFVANGVLGDGGEHGVSTGNCKISISGEAGEGECNLYVYHAGVTHLIAVLSGEDFPDWSGKSLGSLLSALTARVSPDGGWLAFMSNRSLTGYDNRDAVSGKLDEEVFLYRAATGGVVCVSCDPSGARPVGVEYRKLKGGLVGGSNVWGLGTWVAGNVPGWTPFETQRALYQSRYLSDSGRLFFNSDDALVPRDVNGNWDVYEFEPAGVGSCTAESVGFRVVLGGCVGLISSGRGAGESAFVDASESGGDVFFLTGERLVSRDVDSAVDLYDAHACSSEAPCVEEPELPPACVTADACRAAPSPQPEIFGAPASATFSGPGNLAPTPTPTLTPPPSAEQVRVKHLASALKACRTKRNRGKRVACEKQARKRYAVKSTRASRVRLRKTSSGRRAGS